MRLLAAPDKLAGTLSAPRAAAAIARGAHAAGWEAVVAPVSDGGEGFAEVLGGDIVDATVSGPLGRTVQSTWRLRENGATAVIEMAHAAGRSLLPDPIGDDCINATTRGVGELIIAARDAGATTIIVGCGGSATTDGGRGCLDVIEEAGGLDSVPTLLVATDVTTHYLDAARRFGPQKGASPAQVNELSQRLVEEARRLEAASGLSISTLERAGAAGGLAGGLASIGGQLVSGFDLVARELRLEEQARSCDLVVTGEGRLDASTLEGKAIASLLHLLPDDKAVVIVAGEVEAEVARSMARSRSGALSALSLVDEVGRETALTATERAIAQVIEHFLAGS